jgi:hypothetical protein
MRFCPPCKLSRSGLKWNWGKRTKLVAAADFDVSGLVPAMSIRKAQRADIGTAVNRAQP